MPSRDLEGAKKAWTKKNREASKKAHMEKDYEPHKKHGKYLKSIVYGGLDGIITTFAVVAGVAGAQLSAGIVLILGFANLIADGISMAVGDYLSSKAENEYHKAERERESWEVANYPEGEKKEMVEIYMEKGMDEKDAIAITEILSKNKKTWVDVMMVEELGIIEENESPINNAIATFIAFVVFGFAPLIAYIIALQLPVVRQVDFLVATIITGITIFSLGALKVKMTEMNWLRSGLEMLLVGGLAATAAYFIGVFLQELA